MNFFRTVFAESGKVLHDFSADPSNLENLQQAGLRMVASLKAGNKIITCGNGGSMSDAMHMAEELTGRFRDDRPPFAAIAISDPSFLTCTANDYGYDQVFSRFIEGVGKAGDILVAISTSGNSPNIVNAVKTARKNQITVVGLSGASGGKMSEYCDITICVPYSDHSDRIQEIHIMIIHSLIQYIESNMT